jgi:hypothetical protein
MENSWILHKIRSQRSMVPYYLFSVMAVFFTLMVLFGSFFSLEYRIKIFLQTGAEFKGYLKFASA